jgi:hypothetical protein
MKLDKLENHYLYWIDRFDHILDKSEFSEAELMSFVDVKEFNEDSPMLKKYIIEEQKILSFLSLCLKEFDPKLLNIEIRFSFRSRHKKTANTILSKTQLKVVKAAKKEMETTFEPKVTSLNQFLEFCQLAVREYIDLKILVNNRFLTIGYDMSVQVQNIPENTLQSIADKSGLYILSKEEPKIWDWC